MMAIHDNYPSEWYPVVAKQRVVTEYVRSQ